MYVLADVDLGQIAGAQSQPLGQGAPIVSLMVIAAPPNFVAFVKAASGSPFQVPVPGLGVKFCDPIVDGVVVTAPQGQAGHLVLGFNLEPAGTPQTTLSGTGFKGSAVRAATNAANGGALVALANPAGSGIVATVTRAAPQKSSANFLCGAYLAADPGDQDAPALDDNVNNGRKILPVSGALVVAGTVAKCVFRLRHDQATIGAGGAGLPGTAIYNEIDSGSTSAGVREFCRADRPVTLVPGQALIYRSATQGAYFLGLDVEFNEQ